LFSAFVMAACFLQSSISLAQKKGAAFTTGKYRNLLKEAGYSKAEIDAKVEKAYYDVFEGPNRVYFETEDSLGYVSDLKNHDARSEGLSYGMMAAVQLNKKEVFDRIWRWTKKYAQHQTGAREGYFAWSINPKTLKRNSPGSASDGELYFVTSLLFASNRWGNKTGIDYSVINNIVYQAQYLADQPEVTDSELMQFNHQLQNFYKQV